MARPKSLLYGIGINDAEYPVHRSEIVDGKRKTVWRCPYYVKWSSMLQRSYCKSYHVEKPSYAECFVEESWHRFTTFRNWMETQDWKGKQLDKDILFPGNKVYGPDTCIFVDQRVNSFINEGKASSGQFLIGVTFNKRKNKFMARCWSFVTGKAEFLGYFSTEIDAHKAWLTFKLKQAQILASEQKDQRVAMGLMAKYANYKEDIEHAPK